MSSLADYFAAKDGGPASQSAGVAPPPSSPWNSDVRTSTDPRVSTSQKIHWSKKGGGAHGNVLHQSADGLISPTKGSASSFIETKKREEFEKSVPKQRKPHSARNVSSLAMWNENHTGAPTVPKRHQNGSVTRPERNARRAVSSSALINNATSFSLGGGNFSEDPSSQGAAAAKKDWLEKAEKGPPKGLQAPLVVTPADSSYDVLTGKPVQRKSPTVTTAERRRQGLATLNRETGAADADEPAYLQSKTRQEEYTTKNQHSEVRKWAHANSQRNSQAFSRDGYR